MSSSYTTKREAQKAGHRARMLLNHTEGWSVHVWTTCPEASTGYHFKLINGPFSIHTGFDGSFFGLLSDSFDEPVGGSMLWTDHFHHVNPNRVIAHVKRVAQARLAELARVNDFLDNLQS